MKYLVIGGTGFIGGTIAQKLQNLGHKVTVTGSSQLDITNTQSICSFDFTSFDGIVYSVGHCPPDGYMNEISTPLSKLPPEFINIDFNIHVTGLQRLIYYSGRYLKNGATILVISSGITKIPDAVCPPKLYAGHYATVKAALNELVKWLRRDPLIKRKQILIHRLGVGAVDTPFHHGASKELQPPALYSLDEVAESAIKALMSKKVVDYDFNPLGKIFMNFLKKKFGFKK